MSHRSGFGETANACFENAAASMIGVVTRRLDAVIVLESVMFMMLDSKSGDMLRKLSRSFRTKADIAPKIGGSMEYWAVAGRGIPKLRTSSLVCSFLPSPLPPAASCPFRFRTGHAWA